MPYFNIWEKSIRARHVAWGLLEISWDNLGSLGIACDHLGSSGIIWDHMVSSHLTWDRQLEDLSERPWQLLGSSQGGTILQPFAKVPAKVQYDYVFFIGDITKCY